MRDALNHALRTADERIAVAHAAPAAESFHARHDALRRRYLYRILVRDAPPALEAGRVLHLRRTPDLAAMRAAAAPLIGQHDFSSFRAAGCQAASPVRSLERLDWEEERGDSGGAELRLTAEAPSFLYRQVRILAGTLLLAGLGRWPPERVGEALAARRREAAGPTAPASGLYFVRAEYPESCAAPPSVGQ